MFDSPSIDPVVQVGYFPAQATVPGIMDSAQETAQGLHSSVVEGRGEPASHYRRLRFFAVMKYTECCGDTVAGTLTFYVSIFISVCANVFTWFWFCFVCRIFCSAQHKCVCLGPQQQFDGSGALYKTGFSAAKTSNQNTLTEAQVDLMAWGLFCTLKASKTVQTFVSSRHQT